MAASKMNQAKETGMRQFDLIWGTNGTAEGQFHCPCGIAVGVDGIVYVSDTGNHRLLRSSQCFSSDGRFLLLWGHRGIQDGQFGRPTGIAVGTMERVRTSLLVTLRSLPVLCTFPPGLLPICAAYLGDECLYVVDRANQRLQQFEPDGRFIRKWGTFGSGKGQFQDPQDCAVGDDGFVYVCDLGNHNIQTFQQDGTFISGWSYPRGRFNKARNITVSDGIIYVADSGMDQIHCFRTDGTFIRKWGGCGISLGYFTNPSGLMVHRGMLYIADSCNHRLQQFQLDGTIVRALGKKGRGDGQFCFPEAIAKGTNELMYIADSHNNRIVAVQLGF